METIFKKLLQKFKINVITEKIKIKICNNFE